MARGHRVLLRQLSDRQFLVNISTAFSQQSTHVSCLQLRECHPNSIGYSEFMSLASSDLGRFPSLLRRRNPGRNISVHPESSREYTGSSMFPDLIRGSRERR